jgi:hypothetical protein
LFATAEGHARFNRDEIRASFRSKADMLEIEPEMGGGARQRRLRDAAAEHHRALRIRAVRMKKPTLRYPDQSW